MGTLRYASLDPVFNLHHANIDRIWSLYKDQSGQPIEPDDTSTWYQQWFNFVDVDGTLKSVTVEDAARHMTNVVYQEPLEAGPRKTHRELVAVAAAMPRKPGTRQATPVKAAALAVVETPKSTRGEPINLAPAPQPAPLAAALGKAAPTRALLEFELADLKYTGKFYVQVFVNKDDADATTSIEDKHYVGTLVALDSHAAHHEGKPEATTLFRMPISSSLSNFYKVAPPGTPFKIRLVPVDPAGEFSFTVKRVTLKLFP